MEQTKNGLQRANIDHRCRPTHSKQWCHSSYLAAPQRPLRECFPDLRTTYKIRNKYGRLVQLKRPANLQKKAFHVNRALLLSPLSSFADCSPSRRRSSQKNTEYSLCSLRSTPYHRSSLLSTAQIGSPKKNAHAPYMFLLSNVSPHSQHRYLVPRESDARLARVRSLVSRTGMCNQTGKLLYATSRRKNLGEGGRHRESTVPPRAGESTSSRIYFAAPSANSGILGGGQCPGLAIDDRVMNSNLVALLHYEW